MGFRKRDVTRTCSKEHIALPTHLSAASHSGAEAPVLKVQPKQSLMALPWTLLREEAHRETRAKVNLKLESPASEPSITVLERGCHGFQCISAGRGQGPLHPGKEGAQRQPVAAHPYS